MLIMVLLLLVGEAAAVMFTLVIVVVADLITEIRPQVRELLLLHQMSNLALVQNMLLGHICGMIQRQDDIH